MTADVPRLLNALRESERTVILDCPPLTGVAETRILVAKADAVLFVVDARKFDPTASNRAWRNCGPREPTWWVSC